MWNNNSFIRWAGGKSWLVQPFKDLINGFEYRKYFEPFVGGGSIFFAKDDFHKSYLSDINEELINAYKVVQCEPSALIDELLRLKNEEKEYYRIRSWVPDNDFDRAVRFIYLNRTSFNGIYRVNRLGIYNVPYGRRKIAWEFDSIREASAKLQNVKLGCGDFTLFKKSIRKGDLIFLDPPYTVSDKASENGFNKYNPTLFSLDEQKRLSAFIDEIKNRGAFYILTNQAHPTIDKIFDKNDRRIILERACTIGGKKASRNTVKEYLFTNIPERKDD